MILGSRDPRDMHTDPRPWAAHLNVPDWQRSATRHNPDYCWFDPRPEFIPTLSHPVNPILVEFRRHLPELSFPHWAAAIDALMLFGGYRTWEYPAHAYHVLIEATPEQIEHARKVLTRYASVFGVTS